MTDDTTLPKAAPTWVGFSGWLYDVKLEAFYAFATDRFQSLERTMLRGLPYAHHPFIYGWKRQEYALRLTLYVIEPSTRDVLIHQRETQQSHNESYWDCVIAEYVRASVLRLAATTGGDSTWQYKKKQRTIPPLVALEVTAESYRDGHIRIFCGYYDIRQGTGDIVRNMLQTAFPKQWAEDAAGVSWETSAPAVGDTAQPDDQAGAPAVDEETERRLQAVREWPKAKREGVKRRDYVHPLGISESGLTRWRDELRNRGFDVPDF